jgi:outer membrane lipoprotein-sorting protein
MIKENDTPAGLKGIARFKVESPDEKFSVKELVIAKQPGCLRLETLNPLGQLGFFAVTDGKELFLFSPSENKFYHGMASPENMSVFIPLNLRLEEIVSILLGNIPLIDYDTDQAECQAEGDFYVLRLFTKDGRLKQVLKISLSSQKVVESETYEEEALILAVKYGHYESMEGELVPKDISISMPHDKTKVNVRYKKIEFFSEINSAEFRLIPPQGVEVISLE